MGAKLYPYLRELADEAGLDRSDPLLEQMWLSHSAVIAELPHEFRNFRSEPGPFMVTGPNRNPSWLQVQTGTLHGYRSEPEPFMVTGPNRDPSS
ncbi:hypothetical protein BV898_15561 [Hypsibius exemplaris]|uniref:Uncharacterized protein n=1 Tax=Hypsibius exemplaris TaxID=2072580 RepID=A0A9X6ND16_HYPEX|nr:hypothetical protein BV898_15561 [Hypsibius exemplaris]